MMAKFTITVTYPEYDSPILQAEAEAPDEEIRNRVVYHLAETLANIADTVTDESGNLPQLAHNRQEMH